MLLTPDQIHVEALSLPPAQRAELAELLLASLGEDTPETAQREWLQTALRRLDDLRDGLVECVDGEEALARARNSLCS